MQAQARAEAHTPLDSPFVYRHRLPHVGSTYPTQGRDVKQPGKGGSDTLSYDRAAPPDGAGSTTPAPSGATSVAADGLVADGRAPDQATPRERPGRADPPLAVVPTPEAPSSPALPTSDAPSPVIERVSGAFRAGDLVDHFEIVGLIGQGGMGCVYKAFDRDLGRTVAIKTLHGIDEHAPHSLARFKREAQAASRVVHPNLVIIYSSGNFGATPYIVMEYLSGRSLAAEIAGGPIPVERTVDILVAACAGVYAAHRAGVVHRDLKPGNIFLAHTPMGETPKILDFGISRIGDDNSSLTGTGDVVGTTYYLAPEQAAGREIDARVDQYALGVILYECLTGVRPFTGSAVFTIMRNIVDGIFQPPSNLRPEIPRALEAVILRAMRRQPNDRFAHVRDLGLALVPFLSAQGRQQWSHHFTAPEAAMPVTHYLPVPAVPGASTRPVPTVIVPTPPPAPTKFLPDSRPAPGQAAPTRTTPAANWVPESGPVTAEGPPISRRGRVVALAVAAVALLALAVWVLARPAAHNTDRPTSSTAATVAPPPPVATPDPPPPRPALPQTEIEPTKPVEAHVRTARSKITSKDKEPGEPADRTKEPGTDHEPGASKW